VTHRIEARADLAACDDAVRLQRTIWGDAVTVPSNMLFASVHVGAFLALAYIGDSAVGFVYSFYGVRDWRFVHHSHMLAVLPEHRGRDIARALKSAQRDYCLEHGLEVVTWTMDPLESRNARFNLAKLGAYAPEYHEDFYGEMPDKLNAGLTSDRFVIEWPIATDRVARRLEDEDAIPSLVDAERDVPWLLPADGDRPGRPGDLGESHHLVATPWDLQAIKSRDAGLARAWRDAHRRTLGAALRSGYAAVEFLVDAERHRGAYLLVKRPPIVEATPRAETRVAGAAEGSPPGAGRKPRPGKGRL
jgi:predicted GNAT superfamily acetyltransferase